MFPEFKPIDDLPELPKKQENKIASNGMIIPWYNAHNKYGFWAQFFYCKCGHIFYNHNIETGKCEADYFEPCDCMMLIFCDAELEITFTLGDLFEEENPNHSNVESPEWMIEFGDWYENKNKNFFS